MSIETNNKEPRSYQSAVDELKAIVYAIENGQIGIDKLSEQIERASKLMSFCKNKLRDIEENLKKYEV